jgi:hypothetical protein
VSIINSTFVEIKLNKNMISEQKTPPSTYKVTPQIERLISFFDIEAIDNFREQICNRAKITDEKITFDLVVHGNRKGRRINIEGYTIYAMVWDDGGDESASSIDSIDKGKTHNDYEKEDSGYENEIIMSEISIENLDKETIMACLYQR